MSQQPIANSSAGLEASDSSRRRAFRWIGAGMQVLAISLCIEMLLSISSGIGILLRLFLLALIGSCVVLRLGWLTLVVVQMSLFLIEPKQPGLAAYPLGFFFALFAIIVIVVAMKAPETHRYATDYLASFFASSARNAAYAQHGFVISRVAVYALQLTLVVVFAGFFLSRLPIGMQAESWQEWSRQNNQAVWPGALLLVFVIAALVLLRENAWRQMVPTQARLYLRSVQLIANYRDLFGFERHRLKRIRKVQTTGIESNPNPNPNPISRPKLRRNGLNDKNKRQGSK